MATFIIILAFLSLVHFIYDGIILPSLRFKARNQLFSVRDEIRNHYIEDKNTVDIKAFNVVHDGISRMINKLHLLTPHMLVSLEAEYKHNEDFRKVVIQRSKTISDSNDEFLIECRTKANNVLDKAIIANMGTWFIYLLPFAIVAVIIDKSRLMFKKKIANFTNEVISTTSQSFIKLEKQQMRNC